MNFEKPTECSTSGGIAKRPPPRPSGALWLKGTLGAISVEMAENLDILSFKLFQHYKYSKFIEEEGLS